MKSKIPISEFKINDYLYLLLTTYPHPTAGIKEKEDKNSCLFLKVVLFFVFLFYYLLLYVLFNLSSEKLHLAFTKEEEVKFQQWIGSLP